jgi:precorrin-6Y C5,15-methyltransferase (decarboxylating)
VPEPCALIGILEDGWAGLSEGARARLRAADCVIGTRRNLNRLASNLASGVRPWAMDGALSQVPERVRQAQRDGQRVAVLATGDPLCQGIGAYLLRALGAEGIEVLPAPSTLQLAYARLKRPWHEVHIVSVHGADTGDWAPGATPDHGLYRLVRAVAEHPRVAVFTSPENAPRRIARALLAAGYGTELRLSVVARLGWPDEAVFADLSLVEANQRNFPDPNIVVLERTQTEERPLLGLADDDYEQRRPRPDASGGLITKFEVRAVSLAKLGLRADSTVWDIGAGSGSVGLEAARLAQRGHIWAIEKNSADAVRARANAERLRASNYTLVQGKAPAGLEVWPDPDAVFIGGSGGELETLIGLCLNRLKPDGRLVMNFTVLENLARATAALTQARTRWEVVQLQCARSRPILDLHRLEAQNPVWIVTAYPTGDQRI